MLLNSNLNASDKVGLAGAFGFADDHVTALSNQGHYINKSIAGGLNSLTFSYSLPLIGILGSGTDKYIPIGDFYSLRYELTMDNYANFTVWLAGTNTNKVSGCTISEVEFVGQVVELDSTPQSMIEAANPNVIHIRSQSYRTATNFLAAQSTGLQDILIGTRVSSLKSMYVTCSPSNAIDGKFGSVCPNLGQGSCLVLSSQNWPQRTLNVVAHPSDCFAEFLKSLGALSTAVYNGSINKTSYYTSSTQQGLMQAYSTAVSGNNIYANPNMWVMGINTETCQHRNSLLSGVNINGAPSFFRAQITAQLSAYTHTLYFFAYHDLILEIDRNAKTIVAKF
jgi:hypothetical protein